MLNSIFNKQFWKGQRLLLLAFLLLHFIITIVYVKQQPLTNDEADYIEYSKRWLKGEPLKVKDVDDSKTPVVAIAWLPRIYKQVMKKDLQMNDWGRSDQLSGRYMMFVFFWGVFIYVYLWAKKLYGRNGWIIPVLLLIIDPLFMAFTPIVTSDMACVFVLLATMYHAFAYNIDRSWKHFLLLSFFSGVALVTKSSLVFIPLILLIVLGTHIIMAGERKARWKYYLTRLLLYIFICWLVVNSGYYFYNSFEPWSSYNFKSTSFISLFNHLEFLKPLPRLLPEPFIQGFDLLQYHKEIGPFTPNFPFKGVFIMGEKYPTGVWFYYLLTGLIKVPIGIIVLLIISAVLFLKHFRLAPFINKYQFIVVPVVVYGVMLSFFNPFQQGLRHAMILFPFLYLGVGWVWIHFSKFYKKGRLIIGGCILYSLVSTATAFPDIMHYSNEFITDKKNLFKLSAEFNYRHGDIKIDCEPFLKKHPDYQLAPVSPTAGKFIIPGAFVYNSTYEVYKNYNWLKQFEPVGQYRYVFLLYDVKKEEFQKIDTSKKFPAGR